MSRALMVLGLITAACAARVPFGKVAPATGPVYCFEAEVENPRGKRAIGCFDTEPLCREALGTAHRLGRLAKVKRIGDVRCARRSFR